MKTIYFPKTVTESQAGDTGMALVLVCLLVVHFAGFDRLLPLAIGLLLVNMIAPGLYKPAAKIWLGLSNVIGTVMSTVMLTAIFFLVVTPVALLRKLSGADPLQLGLWKQDRSSVFRSRNYEFSANDLEKPF